MGRPPDLPSAGAKGRRTCRRCHRPEVMCACRYLPAEPPVSNRTTIFILQHPRERFHPKGTTPLALRGLQRVRLEVAHFDGRGEPARHLDLPPDTGLLYPHEQSRPLVGLAPDARPKHLLLLDGTWGNAHRLYRCNSWLAELPHYHLEPDTPERYRIRGEPDVHGRSTIEAIVGALQVLEPDTHGLEQLIEAFDKMIADQVHIIEREAAGSRKRTRPVVPHPVHAPLLDRYDDVVLVYTESVACDDGQRWPVHWVALRPATGQTFERFLRVHGGEPNARHLAHMELTPEDVASGVETEALRQDWNGFLGTKAVVAAWNQSTLDLVAARTDTAIQPVLLKAAYCNLRRVSSGNLSAVLEREGLAPRSTSFRGRAGRRLGQALAVLALLVGRERLLEISNAKLASGEGHHYATGAHTKST